MSVLRVAKKFGSILSEHQKFRIAELVVLMIIGGFLEMCSVSMVIPFINTVMNPEKTMNKWYSRIICSLFDVQSTHGFLIIMSIMLAIIYILKNIYLLLEFNIQYKFVYNNMFAMQRRLLDAYIHRPYEFFLKINSGEIIRIINNDTPNTFVLLTTLLNLLTELVVSGILIGTIFFITPVTTVCMTVVMFVMLIAINSIIRPVLRKAGKSTQKSAAGMNKWLLQSIQGIKELKVMEKEAYFQENYDKYGSIYVKSLRFYYILNITPRFFIEAVSMGTMFIVIAIMIYSGSKFETIVPILTAVAMAAIRLLPSVNRMANSLTTIAYNEPMLDKLIENLQSVSAAQFTEDCINRNDSTMIQSKNNIGFLRDSLKFDNIYFHYPEKTENIFSSASMVIRTGESIGIIGSSGAGKTTLVDVLLGLLSPQKGKILVDGIDIYQDMSGWHRQIGYIPQMIFLLDDTIKHNVCFGVSDDDISEDRLWEALEEASLAKFVRDLPEGIETEIGERGIRLSGGQRQRIGIARAIYQNPAVLVFDEATSALDNETESEIMASINSLHGNKTMIIIAHRLSTIEECDHIYRVENGNIIMER